jgi:hypothetical protein
MALPTPTGGSMTKAELVEEVSRVSDLTKKHSEVIVDTVFRAHRRAASRREDRAAGLRELPSSQARAAQGPESENGRQGGRPAQESADLPARNCELITASQTELAAKYAPPPDALAL